MKIRGYKQAWNGGETHRRFLLLTRQVGLEVRRRRLFAAAASFYSYNRSSKPGFPPHTHSSVYTHVATLAPSQLILAQMDVWEVVFFLSRVEQVPPSAGK